MAWNPTWEQVFRAQNWGAYPGEDLIRFIARNYYGSDRANISILELGCGPGANIWYLAREGFDAYGVDGSATAVSSCLERLEREHLTASVTVGDVSDLQFDDARFDAVIDIECLSCNDFASSASILDEVARVLKPHGKFYSKTFASDLYIGKNYRQISPLEFDEMTEGPMANKGFVRLTDPESAQALYGTHFEIEEMELSTRTTNNRRDMISEWHITCARK
jgi:SAM-dependent methyltransferase